MKNLCLSFFIFGMFLCTVGCSSELEVTTMSFSAYYQCANNFDKIEPALNLYFSCIRSAYDNSNKTDLKSFELADEYADAKNTLKTFLQSNGDLSDSLDNDDIMKKALAKLQLLEPYLKIETMLEERLLLLEGDKNAKDVQWFDRLNSLVWDSIDEYRRGGE